MRARVCMNSMKLFLAHFWQVAHILDGEEMTQPWSVAHGGHDESHIIAPYYFNGDLEDMAAGNELDLNDIR